MVDRVVGLVISGFDFGQGSGGLGRATPAVGERAADALVEEDEEQGPAGRFLGETKGVAPTIALQQSVGFELAQVVSQLGKRVAFGVEGEAGQNRLMCKSQDLILQSQ